MENTNIQSDPGKEFADYIDSHIVASMVQIATAYEISDEEIKKQSEIQIVNNDLSWEVDYARESFIAGVNWYREHVKKKLTSHE